jgi:hypothetical protein
MRTDGVKNVLVIEKRDGDAANDVHPEEPD